MLIGGFVFTHGEEPVSQEGVSSYSYRSKMSGKQRRKVLMNRNDMPFLGVYDNVRYSPNCTPTYQHWGWGFVSEHFVPQVFFPDYLERGMADSNSIPFLYLYTNRREFVELYRQRTHESWRLKR